MTKLIPFDRDKYEKGAKAVRKDGLEIYHLFFEKDGYIFQIFRVKAGHLNSAENDANGKYMGNEDHENDLFLEVETIDFWIGISKNGLTSQAFLNKEDVRHGWDAIVKVSLDSETFEQI